MELQAVNGIKAVRFPSRLDANTSKEVESELGQLIDSGTTRLICDLSGTGYISSAGLRLLLALSKRLSGPGAVLALSGLQPEVIEVMDMTGFTPLFRVFPTIEAAAAGLS